MTLLGKSVPDSFGFLMRLLCLGFVLFGVATQSRADIVISGPVQSPADPVLDQSGAATVTYNFSMNASAAVFSLSLGVFEDTGEGLVDVSSSFSLVSSTNSVCSAVTSITCGSMPVGLTSLVLSTTTTSTQQRNLVLSSTECTNDDETTCSVNNVNFSLQARAAVPGTFEFSQASYSVKEYSGRVAVQVNRNNGVDGAATVSVATVASRAANAATANEDYAPVNQVLSFAAGEAQKTFDITVVQDSKVEGAEVLQLVLSNPSAGASAGQAATLTITDSAGLNDAAGLSENQSAVAAALDTACPSATGALAQRCAELTALSAGDLKNALDQIAPGALFGEGSQAMQITQVQLLNLRNRLNVVRTPNGRQQTGNLNIDVKGEMVPLASIGRMLMDQGGAAGEDEASSPWGVFANGRLNVGRKDARSNLDPGFKFENQNITLGADYRSSDTLVLGGAFGYATSNTNIGLDRGSLDVGAWYVSHYGNWYPLESLYVDWVATAGKADYDSVRKIKYTGFSSSADSNTAGKQYSASVSVGSDVANGPWQLGSYARLDWAQASIDSFAESGGNGLALNIGEQKTRQNTFILGGKASRAISWSRGVIIPGVFLEAAHELQDNSRKVTASFVEAATTSFSVSTAKPDANYFNYGFNFVSVFTQGRSAFFNVQGVAGLDGRTSYAYEAGGRFEF